VKEITVKIAEDREYKICIEKGILNNLGEHLSNTIENKSVIVITNPLVNSLCGAKLLSALKKGGFSSDLIQVPDGEKYKSLSTAKYLYDELLKRKADRTTALIALGGGVIGDLTGFVAATYMRGLSLIHIPTTLLAQVDSSIGGKVAVDHPLAKNIIGSFYQPKAVYTDPEVLQTLSDKDMKNGIVEATKIAVIKSPTFFKWLEKNVNQLLKKHKDLLCELVKEAVSLKVDIVLKDPRESGLRKALNFGHSIGHALEVEAGYQDLSHGEAVALGMLIETKIACNRGMCSEEFEKQIKHILSFLLSLSPFSREQTSRNQESKLGEQLNISSSPSSLSSMTSFMSFPPSFMSFPPSFMSFPRKRESIFKHIKNLNYNQLWETLTLDKKNSQGKVIFILPEDVGKVTLVDNITKAEVIKALKEFKKEWKLC